MQILSVALSEPQTWFMAFHVKPSGQWYDRLCFGRFKHVSAFAYVPGFGCWIFYDAEWRGLRLLVATQAEAERRLRVELSGCAILKLERRWDPMPTWTRFGYWCVPAMRHLSGSRSIALTPNGLYRSLLRSGATLIRAAETADRPPPP